MNKPSAGKRQKNSRSDIGFLSRALEELTDFPEDADIYVFISQSLQQIARSDAVILVNSYDSITRRVTLWSISGVEPWRDQIESILGRPLEGLSFIIPAGADIPLQRGGLDELHGGLSALSFGYIPEEACRKIESLSFFGRIFGTGISWKGQLHGSVIIIRPPGRDLGHGEVISLFVRQVAGYLRRKQAETDVNNQYSTFRGIINSSDSPIFSLDRDYRYTSFNTSHAAVMKAIYGAKIEVGHNLLDYMTVDEDRVKAKKNIDRALAGEQFTDQEYSGEDVRKRLFFEISHNPIREPGGAVTGVAVYARDITERRKIELALRESEETAKALINATTESALLIDRDGILLAVNTTTARRLGHTVDEILGRDALTLLPPDIAASRRSQIAKVIRTGKPVQFEDVRFGRVIENNISPVLDDNGNVIRCAVFGRDITDERNARAALQKSEQFLSDVLGSIQQGISVLDKDMRILRVNPVMETWYAHAMPLVGKKCFEVYHLRNEPCETCPVHETLATGKAALRTVPKTGAGGVVTGWQDLYSFPLIDSTTHEMTGVIEYVHDITDRRNAEDALRRSEKRLKLALHASDLGIWTWDIAADERHVYAGGGLLFGYTEHELEEYFRNIEVLAHPQDRGPSGSIPTTIRQSSSGDPVEFELRIRDKGGAWNTMLIRGNVVRRDPGGRPLLMMGVFRDITERKNTDDQILQISALKEQLLGTAGLDVQIRIVCDAVVGIFGADFARIWLTAAGDLCDTGCQHAKVTEGPDVCRDRAQCLHLMVSSGRYTHTDGGHRRVPIGCYKIGRVASGEDPFFITNDVTHDPRVHDHAWAESLGLVSFAGFRLMSADNKPAGVLALFRKFAITPKEQELLSDLANTLSHVISSGIAARALEDSEEKFRTFADFTFDWEYWIAPDTSILYTSPSCERITGYPPETFYNNKGFEGRLIHPEDRQIWEEHLAQASRSEGAESVDYRIRHRDGSIRWIAHSCQPVYSAVGELMGRRASNRDISRRKEVEDALRESETRYRSFVQSFRGIAYLSTADWVPVFFHGAVEEITGYTEKDFITGNPRWDQVIHPEDLGEIQQRDTGKLLSEPGCCIQREYRITRKDGQVRWLSDFIQNRIDDRGELLLSGILTDITARKQAEEAFRESEKRYRDMFEINNAVMLILDPVTAMIVDANAAAARFYGYSLEELRSMSISSINTMERSEIQNALSHAAGRDGAVFHFRHRKKSGEVRDVEVFSAPIMVENKPLLHSIIQDITERKRAEDALRKTNRKLNLLSGVTRHDIKNQLLALSGFLEISKQSLSDPATTAEFIAKEERIADTIAHQITFTKDYEDLGVNAPLWQNVDAVIRRAVARLPLGNVRVITGDTALEIFADPLLEKVFYNLTDNALRYGGEKMTGIRVSHQINHGDLILNFEDDGEGIRYEDKARLFTKGFGRHTGLGLYLSREILSITDITIAENGEPGKGARFEITIPYGFWRGINEMN